MTFSYCNVKASDVTNNSEITREYNPSDVTAVLSTYTYETTGIVRTPSVTVTDANGTVLNDGIDYTVSYDEGRIKPGQYNVTVTLMGNYTGSRNLSFTIKGNSGKVDQSGRWFYKDKRVKGKKSVSRQHINIMMVHILSVLQRLENSIFILKEQRAGWQTVLRNSASELQTD